MNKLIHKLALVSLLLGSVVEASAQLSDIQAGAERRARDLAAAISTGDRAEFRRAAN